MLVEQSDEQASVEIASSRDALLAGLRKPVWALAYPFGDAASVGSREYEMAERAGYECAFVNETRTLKTSFSRFAIPRVHITSDMSLPVYAAHVSGVHEAIRHRFSRRAAMMTAGNSA
jgi:hypothetical protein